MYTLREHKSFVFIRGFLYSTLSDTIFDTNESEKNKNCHEEKESKHAWNAQTSS